MASFSSLHIGVTALSMSQRAVEVAAHNVANAGTEGFTRQRLHVGTAIPTTGTLGLRGDGQRGMGVTVIGVERLRDRLSDVALRHQSGVHGSAVSRSTVLDRVEEVTTSYGDGAPVALASFFAAFDALSTAPDDPAARSTVVARAEALVTVLGSSSAGLDQVREEVGLRLDEAGREVNDLLAHVAELNVAIRDSEVDLASPNDLRDKRDVALDRLATLVGATSAFRPDGMVVVSMGPTVLLDGPTASSIAVDGASEPPTVTPATGLSGSLGGLLRAAVSDLPLRRGQLDDLALQLRDAVNAVHGAHKDLTGADGGPFFTGDSAASLRVSTALLADYGARSLAVSKSGKALDGEGALTLAALRTTPGPSGSSLYESFRSFAGQVGQAAADAERTTTIATSALDAATQGRMSLNGVNVDEEMVDLVKFQHAYSAASRVITVIDEMLDKIINQMGR